MKMKFKILMVVIILLNINLIYGEVYYNFGIDYNDEKIKINSIEVIVLPVVINYSAGTMRDYSAEIKDLNGKVLNQIYFKVPNEIWSDEINSKTGEITIGTIKLENVSFKLLVPYSEKGKEIIIYDENKKEAARKDLSEYLRILNGREKVIKDKDEEAVKEDKSEKKNLTENNYMWIFGIILVVLIVLSVYLLKRFKRTR